MNRLQTADLIVFVLYFLVVAIYGVYINRKKKSAHISSQELFFRGRFFNLAAKYLPATLKV
jgi:Na+/proline symporter